MNNFTRKVIDVKTETTEKEISRDEKVFKNGGSLVMVKTKIRTEVIVVLECGHVRKQLNGMRDITKAKSLECHECEIIENKKLNPELY